MAKKKSKKSKFKQKSPFVFGFLILAAIVIFSIAYGAMQKSDSKTNPDKSKQNSETTEAPDEQTIEFTKQIFSNTYKNTASDSGDGFVTIKEMDLRFPESDDHLLGYWIAAKVNGAAVGASVADLKKVSSLLNEKTAKSLQDIKDCYEGLSIFATDKPTGYQYLYKKKLNDDRTYEVRQSKKECTVYIGEFTEFLSKAESI